MKQTTQLSPRRAEFLALLALGLQLLFFVLVLLIGQRAYSRALGVEAWHFLGGILLWGGLVLQFRQRRLAEEERLDADQLERLRREGRETSVFESGLVESEMRVAQRRLEWMERWLLPVVGMLTAGYLLGVGYWQLTVVRGSDQWAFQRELALEAIAVLAVVALVSFLFSRYAVGMSQVGPWRPLRAGGSYLLSNALACFAAAVVLVIPVLTGGRYLGAERILGYVISVLLMVLGVEIVLNLILDAFRPRVRGQYHRAAFESRLLGLFSEPGGILRTAAHAIDYQFGFKVSETWFYKLLERAVVPLVLLWAVSLYLLSCFAIVPAGSVGVLERWGRPVNASEPYGAGLHVKLPWPADRIRSFPVEQIQELEIGFQRRAAQVDESGRRQADMTPILWTQEHWEAEAPFLLPAGDRREPEPAVVEEEVEVPGAGRRTAQVNLDKLVIAVSVQYRIRDVEQYGYGGGRSEDRGLEALGTGEEDRGLEALGTGGEDRGLEALGTGEEDRGQDALGTGEEDRGQDALGTGYCYENPRGLLGALCNRVVLHYASTNNLESVLGPGRDRTARILGERIQAEADRLGMGVEVTFTGLVSVHPPIEIAESFEKVVSAIQQKQASILRARGEANATVADAEGQREVALARAEAYRVERGEVARAEAERFEHQVLAYDRGGSIYVEREYLSVLDEMLPGMRKYILGSERVGRFVYELDLKEKLQPDFFQELGAPNVEQGD